MLHFLNNGGSLLVFLLRPLQPFGGPIEGTLAIERSTSTLAWLAL